MCYLSDAPCLLMSANHGREASVSISPGQSVVIRTRGLEATRARVQEHLDAGASSVVIQVLGEAVNVPPRADWAALADALL
jgi:hypothetical protein